MDDRMHALVLTFDRLPLGCLGCYGCQWMATPAFDRLAASSALFEQHFAEYVDATSSDHAWWTGCYRFPRRTEQLEGVGRLGEILRSAGVKTHLLWEGPDDSAAGIGRNFDVTTCVEGAADEAPFARLIEAAIRVLETSSSGDGSRTLCWLKSRGVPEPCVSPHEWPRDSEDDRNIDGDDDSPLDPMRTRCAEAVSTLDGELGRLLDALERLEGSGDWLLAVTAAQGGWLGEHPAELCESSRLWEEFVHTPLLLRGPGIEPAGRFQALVQAVDLTPTLLDFFGVAAELWSCEGKSLWPLLNGECRDLRKHLCLGDGYGNVGLRTQEYFFVHPPQSASPDEDSVGRMFVKPDDVWDQYDVAAQSPQDVERLWNTLEQFIASARASVPAVFPKCPLEGFP